MTIVRRGRLGIAALLTLGLLAGSTTHAVTAVAGNPLEGDLDAFFQVEWGNWYDWPDASLADGLAAFVDSDTPGATTSLNTSAMAGSTITYRLESPRIVSLQVFDATGRVVRTLLEEPQIAGDYEVEWDGQDDQFTPVPGGVYFYRIEAGADRTSGEMRITTP